MCLLQGVGAGFSELACVSYAARRCGLRNGMIVRDAIKRCPQLVCLPYTFDEYRNVARTVYTIVARYTLEIKAVSCDEMYVDCTKLFDELRIRDPVSFAEHLRDEIRRETGCPASVGIGRSTLMARLATRYAKPDGVRHVPAEESDVFIANEKVRNLPGLGYQTYSKLVGAFGPIEKCSELHMITRNELERLLGKKAGDQLYKMCRGESEDKDFIATNLRKSVSCDINYGIRFTKKSEVAHFLKVVGLELEKKLASAKMATRSITLKLMIRCADAPVETPKYLGHGECNVQNKSASLDHPTGSAKVITTIALKLFTNMDPVITDLRGKSKGPHMLCNIRKWIRFIFALAERELPMVFSTESPTFFGERNMVKIKDDMHKYLKNEPNEDAVGVVTDFLFYLLRDGSLTTLISTCLFIHRELYSTSLERTTNPEWIFAMNLIFNSLDEKCRILYGAPAIRPAILNCKES
ncbi:ImpB/MucB/SamB family protein [Ancylostoma caninum]|uniref:DNA repair protein REV1 n=1 Tax=Ancylostoma caninum TaxID=29170 RepID=A0A368GQD7_ANCCA|nr:ImpB/MucB/SamB family protein [Ancylostoma caninum]